MNNRFKFRVWDKVEGKYNGFSFHLAMSGELDRLSVDGDLLETDEERFIIERCTGLRDKNGHLIYEGDVVKCDLDQLRKNLINQVVWWKGCFCMKRGIVQKEVCEYYNLEIIGNIHEMEGLQ